MQNKGNIVSREKLMQQLWETDSFVDENTLTVNINRLRKKLDVAGLIIYDKQISEGYEDQSHFNIMQKVGMTECEIKRNINSQVLTVFFMPLITAGFHLVFAFPLIQKMHSYSI